MNDKKKFPKYLKNLWINNTNYEDKENISEETIKKILESHIGFENVKENFTDYSYFYSETGGNFHPLREVISFAGAPGTGKTSFVNTLKEATGRKLETIACAGLKDFKNYSILGDKNKPSLVGWVINKSECKNPIILLDELEKVSEPEIQNELKKLFENYVNNGHDESKVLFDEYYGQRIKLDHITFFATVNYPDQLSPQLKKVVKMHRLGSYSKEDKIKILKKKKEEIETRLQGIYGGEKENIITEEIINELVKYIHEDGIRQTERVLYKIEKEYIRCRELGENFSLGDFKQWLETNVFPYQEKFVPSWKHYFLFGLWGVIWILLLILIVEKIILRKKIIDKNE